MALNYKNSGPWGAGSGAGVEGKLTSLQGDNNFFTLDQRMAEVEALLGAGLTFADPPVTTTGGSITFHFTDGSSDTRDVIIPLPIAAFQSRGEWQNSTSYKRLDIVSVRTVGIFLALQDHSSPASPTAFDPEEGDSDGPFWQQIGFLRDVDYDIAFSVIGDIVADAALLAKLSFARSVVLRAEDSAAATAHLETAIGVAIAVFPLYKNDAVIGTITFTFGEGVDGFGGQSGTIEITEDVSFESGDRIKLFGPPDDSDTPSDGVIAADLSVTIPTVRADI